MQRLTFLTLFLFATLVALAAPAPLTAPATQPATAPAVKTKIKATLEVVPDPIHKQIIRMTVKNTGTAAVSFVDVPEGTGHCDRYWDIQVKLSDDKVLKPQMKFAPGSTPKAVVLLPGETYTRDFHLSAYLRSPSPPPIGNEQANLVIRYRVTPDAGAERVLTPPHITFVSEPLQITARDFFPESSWDN